MARGKYTSESGKKAFDLYKHHGTYTAVGEEMSIDPMTAKGWIEKHKATQKKSKAAGTRNGKKESLAMMQALQDDNAFLLWWNEGERRGYVERLLSRLNETSN